MESDNTTAPAQAEMRQAPEIQGLTEDQIEFYQAMLQHVLTDYRELTRRTSRLQAQMRGLRLTAHSLCRVLGETPDEDIEFRPSSMGMPDPRQPLTPRHHKR